MERSNGSSVVVVAKRCLFIILLLLQTCEFCYSQQAEYRELDKIEDSIERISKGGKGSAAEKVAIGLMRMVSSMASDCFECNVGWHKLRSTCYFISENNATWEQSIEKCEAMNATFVKITHDDEFYFLRDLVKGKGAYIGLSDRQEEGTFRWVSDGSILPKNKSWWAEGEPNNKFDGKEDCVQFSAYASSDYRLNDRKCDTYALRYICEKPAQLKPEDETP